MVSTRKKPTLREVPDGRQLLGAHDAALLLGVPMDTLNKWQQRGHLHPAKYGSEHIYTRTELLAFRTHQLDRDIAALLNDNVPPIEVWERLPHASLERVIRVLREWARLSGFWVVEAPPGSFARWLARFKLVRFGPVELRRAIERLLESGPP